MPYFEGNDLQNGILGFAVESLDGLALDEDSIQRTTQLKVLRQADRLGKLTLLSVNKTRYCPFFLSWKTAFENHNLVHFLGLLERLSLLANSGKENWYCSNFVVFFHL